MYYKGKKTLLAKNMSTLDVFFFTLGNILGPQIFILLGGLVLLSSHLGIISLIICGIISIFVAMIYSELALSMPTTGLVVNAVNDAFGGFPSFIVGWSQLFGNISFAAVSALGFGFFIGNPLFGAITVVIVLTFLQIIGIGELRKFENILTGTILLFFIIIISSNISNITALGAISINISDFGNIQKIFLGVGFFFLAFTGFEDSTAYSEELKDVKKLPIVMFLSIVTITTVFLLIYILLINGIVAKNPIAINQPLEYLSQTLFMGASGIIVKIIGIAATLSSLMAVLNTSARNVLAMSEKGFLPKTLYTITEKGIPIFAILLACIFSLAIIISGSLNIIVYLANFIYFFNVILLTLALRKLRDKRKKLDRPFKIPLYGITSGFIISLMIFLMFFLELKSLAFGFIWLFFGFVLYMLRIVGEFRLKIAIIGGNVICSIFFVIILLALEDIIPTVFFKIRPLILISLFLFLIFSFILILDIINYRRKSSLTNQ